AGGSKDAMSNGDINSHDHAGTKASTKNTNPKVSGKTTKKNNVFDIGGFFKKPEDVDYNQPPTFYDSNKF
ncbi:hypothetical protein PSYPI_37913, partial [Pseudomonas syringae pv. pisi str. 1704B]